METHWGNIRLYRGYNYNGVYVGFGCLGFRVSGLRFRLLGPLGGFRIVWGLNLNPILPHRQLFQPPNLSPGPSKSPGAG